MTALLQRLRSQTPTLLTISVIPSPTLIEVHGLAGFDGVIFDMEHGPFTTQSVAECIVAAERRSLSPLVRLPFPRLIEMGALLDLGVEGVVIPHVQTAAMAAEVAREARFRPHGERGANSWVRAAAFSGDHEYYARENERVAVIVQIEGPEGLANADDIIATDGVDGVFVGPVDLSHSLGVPDQLEHELIVDAVGRIAEAAHARGKSVCVYGPAPEQLKRWKQRGVDVGIYGVDANLILAGLSTAVSVAREAYA